MSAPAQGSTPAAVQEQHAVSHWGTLAAFVIGGVFAAIMTKAGRGVFYYAVDCEPNGCSRSVVAVAYVVATYVPAVVVLVLGPLAAARAMRGRSTGALAIAVLLLEGIALGVAVALTSHS